jgi:hypothetical protein
MSTLADDAQFAPPHSNTLRPPGAVPPPPRPVPQLVKPAPEREFGSATAIATPIPSVFVNSQPAGSETLASAPHEARVATRPERPDTLHELSGSGVHGGALPNAAAPAKESQGGVQPQAEPNAAAAKGSPKTALLVLSVGCVALTIALGFSLHALSTRPAPPPTVAASAVGPVAATAGPVGCVPLVPPAKLAGSVERAVEPTFLDLSPERVAVGFAAARTQAAGIIVELNSLDQTPAFEEQGERAVLGVVPTEREPLVFTTDRDSAQLSSSHSLDVSPRAVLGFTKDGLVTQKGDEAPSQLWATPDVPKTEPRVARMGEKHAVLFRQGGQAGTLLAGWLAPDLRPIGDLSVIEGCPSLLGTPALTASKTQAVAAFAGRDSEQEPWRLRLARLVPDQPPKVSAEFAHPSEGAGNGAIAPTLRALGGEHWVLQWTQGTTGQYRVFVQALAADLTPLGAPVPSSPKGASAGQGSIWVTGERALSLYVLTVGGRDELWGSVLTCR